MCASYFSVLTTCIPLLYRSPKRGGKRHLDIFFKTQTRTLNHQQWRSEASKRLNLGRRPSTFLLRREIKVLLMMRTQEARATFRVTLVSYFTSRRGVRCVCLWYTPCPFKIDLWQCLAQGALKEGSCLTSRKPVSRMCSTVYVHIWRIEEFLHVVTQLIDKATPQKQVQPVWHGASK